MKIFAAIVFAGLLIAAAILFVFRWEVTAAGLGAGVVRHDRWTGNITRCAPSAEGQYNPQRGDVFECE